MNTKHSITWLNGLALALALAVFPALVFGQGAPNLPKEPPKAKEPPKVIAPPKTPKEAPKAPKTPQIAQLPNVPKEPPKTPNVPKQVNVPNPPKTVNVPNVPKNIPKVVEAPKVPKVPNVPKTPPVVKAPPVVKVPDAPKVPKTPVVVKVPDVPKVPKAAPKVPAIAKVPDAPKDAPKAPKTPVVVEAPKVPKSNNAPATASSAKTPKTPRTPVVVTKVVETPQAPGTGNNSAKSGKTIAKDATVQEALDIVMGNKRKTNPGGPTPDLPGVDRSSGKEIGLPGAGKSTESAMKDAVAVLQGKGTSEDKQSAIPTDKNNKPGFNQGFDDKPKDIDPSVKDNLGRNPLNPLTDGSIAGPLGDAARSSGEKGPGGIAGQGTGAISYNKINAMVITEKFKQDMKVDATDKSKAPVKEVTDLKGNTTFTYKDGSTLLVRADGTSKVRQEYAGGEESTEYDKSGKGVATTVVYEAEPLDDADEVAPAPAGGGVKTPREEASDPAALAKFLNEHPAIAEQIVASRSGGSGNIDFGNADNTTASGPRNGVVPPASNSTGRNLVGQPGRAGGEGNGANGANGRDGIDFNGKAGAIDPGPDQTVTAGNRQDDPGKALGDGKPGPTGVVQAPKSEDEKKPNYEPGGNNGRPNLALSQQTSGGGTATEPTEASPPKTSKEAIVQEALEIIRANHRDSNPGGPAPDVPGVDRSSGREIGLPGAGKSTESAMKDAVAVLQGKGTDEEKQSAIPTDKTNKPGFDQGFDDKPKDIDSSVKDNLGRNPLNALTGGSIAGPLGDAARNSGGNGPGGIVGQGNGAISDGKNALQNFADKVASMGSGAKAGTAEDQSQQVPVSSVLEDPNYPFKDGKATSRQGEHGTVSGVEWKDGRRVEIVPNGDGTNKLEVSFSPGSLPQIRMVPNGDATNHVEVTGGMYSNSVTVYEWVGEGKETKLRKVTPAGGGVKTPSEDAADPAAFAKFLNEHPAIAEQIVASRSGGSGNIDFGNADNTTASGPRNGIVPPASNTTGRNLVGQPGSTGGEGNGANGRDGIDFNGNAGAIDPGPDQTVTAGNRQEDPGKALGDGKPKPGGNLKSPTRAF